MAHRVLPFGVSLLWVILWGAVPAAANPVLFRVLPGSELLVPGETPRPVEGEFVLEAEIPTIVLEGVTVLFAEPLYTLLSMDLRASNAFQVSVPFAPDPVIAPSGTVIPDLTNLSFGDLRQTRFPQYRWIVQRELVGNDGTVISVQTLDYLTGSNFRVLPELIPIQDVGGVLYVGYPPSLDPFPEVVSFQMTLVPMIETWSCSAPCLDPQFLSLEFAGEPRAIHGLTLTAVQVPEPSVLGMLVMGGVAAVARRRARCGRHA